MIDHVVVLMLENRSFDSMLGRLYQSGPGFDGLTENESNPWQGKKVKVWSSPGSSPEIMTIPDPGPHESFEDMAVQIFGGGTAADMSGFVSNYMSDPARDPKIPMHYFLPDQVPALTALARGFGVSDRWFASAPTKTWPNRFFAHTGTAGGSVTNKLRFPKMTTIYNRVNKSHRSWRIYYHDIPHALLLQKIWSDGPDHLYHFEDRFLRDAQAGNLPNYSFIEPRYFPSRSRNRLPNDQHPPHDVSFGDRLIARCYDALRNGPGWERTLFIITYDEHGGLYDHVPPPAAVPPEKPKPGKFAFDRYGVRVPAVIVSPWIPPGSVIRPPKGAQYPFDHTSILSTLRTLFGLGQPLTARDAAAPDLLAALSLPQPTNGGPQQVPLVSATPTPAELAAANSAPPNSMQEALAEAGAALPGSLARASAQAALVEGPAAPAVPAPAPATVAAAKAQAEAGFARLLGGPAN